MEGPIFGGAYVRKEICVIKLVGLACSGKEIYHFCFVLLCIRGQLPSTRKRDNASKAKQRKIDVQQTRTRDLLKLLCQDKEVFTVVADTDDGGELKLKRALELQEINFSVLRTLQPRSHYNSLLFLRKEGFFAEDAVKIDERLEIMREKVKTFKGYTSASQASDEDSD